MAEMKPGCRLYLQFPIEPSAALANGLAQAIAGIDPACVLLCPDQAPPGDSAATLVDFVHEQGLACLIAGDPAYAAQLHADGVHIAADPAIYTDARERLGADANIGAACGLNRHDAMLLAEMGADYIAFDASDANDTGTLFELISWWSEIFVVPCVAMNIASAETAAQCAGLGADFVAPALDIWRQDNGLQLLAEIDRAVRQSRRAA